LRFLLGLAFVLRSATTHAMLKSVLSLALLAAASAFAPSSMLPTSSRNVAAVGPTMQRIGSARGTGSMGGKQGSMGAGKQGSMGGKQGSMGGKIGSMAGRQGSMAPVPAKKAAAKAAPKAAAKAAPKKAAAPAKKFTGGSGRFAYADGNAWDIEGADWAKNGGIFGQIGDVVWAREAEVKHGRICMLAATGAIVQDLYTFPFMSKWYQGEKMWGLHEAAVKSGALWQVLFFVGLLEIPFLLKLRNGTVDGTGDIGFDPLGLKEDAEAYARRQLTEVKNGRLAMIAIGGMTHHYFLTGKGPIQFLTGIPNFKSCLSTAVETGLCK
jgi:hypothetical protein